MKFNKYLICALFLVLICCIGAASAADAGDDSFATNDTIDEEVTEAIDVSDEIDEEPLGVSEEPALSDGETPSASEKVIYVGTNGTNGGDGSPENPFTTFKAACDSVNGEDKVTVYVFGGEYKLGEGIPKDSSTPLKFNTNNLSIVGLGKVIITNKYDDDEEGLNAEAFQLTSPSSNFTFSNLIFDATNCHVNPYIDGGDLNYFFPFYGVANLGIYNNCSFIGFHNSQGITGVGYNSKFIRCYFERKDGHSLFYKFINEGTFQTFEYCSFNLGNTYSLTGGSMKISHNISIVNAWFGQNTSPSYIGPWNAYATNPDGTWNTTYVIPVNRYAQLIKEHFSISYLGNNSYEIVGKLTWNGTENQQGMENFQPMTVNLVSTTGDINQTATLVNGNFRTIYTSSATNHKVTATLHNEEIELEFTKVNITANPVSIYYGEDQNITFNFTQPITANVTVTVSNGSYNKSERVEIINKDSLVYTVPDTLKAGTYDVEIILAENNLFGFNTTTLTISKVNDYDFNPVFPGENPKVGDDVIITVELPSDANGTVTVYVNNKPFTKEASTNTEITVTGLVAGDNNITVEYSGNDKYAKKSTEQTITAEKVSAYDFDVILPTGVKVGDSTNITIKLPDDVYGAATVYVGTQDGLVVPVNSSSTIVPISGLVAGNNTIKVVFGDGKYVENTVTKNLTVEKVPVEITNNTIVVNTPTGTAVPTVSFNLPNATGNLTVIVKGKTYTKELVNGTATVTITDLPAGTYDATVTYSGDDKFDSITTTTKITVNEAKKQEQKTDSKTKKVTKVATKIVAKNKKFKAKTKVKKYTITLKAGKKPIKKVQVTIKIGKKTFKAKTNAKGKATFKIKKLTKKGKYTAVIKFKGNKAYKASSKKVKITLK